MYAKRSPLNTHNTMRETGFLEVADAENGQYTVRIVAANGKILASSETLRTTKAVEKNVDAIVVGAFNGSWPDLMDGTKEKWFAKNRGWTEKRKRRSK